MQGDGCVYIRRSGKATLMDDISKPKVMREIAVQIFKLRELNRGSWFSK